MSDETTKDLTGDSFSDREILLALRQGLLDLTAEVRAVKGQMSELNERVTRLENRTNPLPPNYEARFTALEKAVARMETSLRDLREDAQRERRDRQALEDRVERLETQAA